jgi:nitroreductase
MRVDKDVAGAVSGERAGVDEVREAVALAVRAPSIHNTQPWRWEFGPDGVDLYADRRRQLAAIDPDGRGLLVSCGAALYLARLGLARQGWRVVVTRFPDPEQPDLLARLVPIERQEVAGETRLLAAAAQLRRSERRPFRPDPGAGGVAGGVEPAGGARRRVHARGDAGG